MRHLQMLNSGHERKRRIKEKTMFQNLRFAVCYSCSFNTLQYFRCFRNNVKKMMNGHHWASQHANYMNNDKLK